MTSSPPSVVTLPASSSTNVHSPLNLRQSLVLLFSAVVATVLTLGIAVLVIILVPGATEIGLVVLGVTLPVHAALLLVVIHWGLRRAGTGWRALGFTRPTLHILHLLWQIPVDFVALILLRFPASRGHVCYVTQPALTLPSPPDQPADQPEDCLRTPPAAPSLTRNATVVGYRQSRSTERPRA